MVAYTYRMPAGIPGDVNRAFTCDIFPEVITPSGNTGAPTAYGIPVVIDATSGQVRSVAAADTAINGFLVRPFPVTDGSPTQSEPLGTSVPPTSGSCSVMVKGCMSVLLSGTASAVKGGAVYVWTAASSGQHVQGGFEAANTAGSTIQVPNCTFRGPADANGITEIMYNF